MQKVEATRRREPDDFAYCAAIGKISTDSVSCGLSAVSLV